MIKSLTAKLKYLYRAQRYKYKLDKDEIEFIIANLKKGQTAIDIGSHKGAYLYWLRQSVGKEGKVYAFELQPLLFNYLKEIKEVMGYRNVQLLHGGASSQNGELTLHVPSHQGLTSAGASFEKSLFKDDSNTYNVPCYRLDDLLKDRKKGIDFIKLDVEGHELEVINGLSEIIQKDRPILLVECEQRHIGKEKMNEVFNFFSNLGYQGSFFWKGDLEKLENFEQSIHQNYNEKLHVHHLEYYANNFIFQPKN